MEVKLFKSRQRRGLTQFFAFFGFFLILFGILLTVAIFTNTLMIQTYANNILPKVSNALFGQKEHSVTSLRDFKRHTYGALKGLYDPVKLSEVRMSIKHEEILKIISSKSKGEKKWVSANLELIDKSLKFPTKVRSKGDRGLHAESLNSMSFRFNIKGDGRLFGLEEFSIQKPLLRGYSWELLIAEIFKSEGMTVLNSVPVDFRVNGDSRGIYIIEEVPSSITIERNKRKDGPIFGLDEEFGTSISSKLDVYDKKKWVGTKIYEYSKSLLETQFLSASEGINFSSEHFDMDEWAKYFALNDVFGTYHGTIPKSVKFYFNPVIGKFQPLLFDAHKGAGIFPDFILLDFLLGEPKCDYICTHGNYFKAFLKNPNFIRNYIKYLEVYSSQVFLNSIGEIYTQKFERLDNRLYANYSRNNIVSHRGYSLWLFKPETLVSRNETISKKLNIYRDKFKAIHLKSKLETLQIENFNAASAIKLKDDVKLIHSKDLDIRTNEIIFNQPTLWLLEGNNKLYGRSQSEPIKLIGPVMIVQNNGSLSVGNLEIQNGSAMEVHNRNWSGTFNVIHSNLISEKITITNNDSEDAINLVSSSFEIGSIEIIDSRSDAIDFDFSHGKINEVVCINIGNDCLDGSESEVTILKTSAKQVKDKVISAGENSKIIANNLSVDSSAIALVAKDGALLSIENIRLNKVDLFAAVFNKKPEYGNPSLIVGTISTNKNIKALQSSNSKLSLPMEKVSIEILSSNKIEALMYGADYGVATEK